MWVFQDWLTGLRRRPFFLFLNSVFLILHSFTKRGENLSDPDLTPGVLDKSRDYSSAVGIDRVRRTGCIRTQWFEQPAAFAQFHPDDSSPFRWTKRVLCFPSAEVADSSFDLFCRRSNAQSVIAITDERRGDSLVSEDGIALTS